MSDPQWPPPQAPPPSEWGQPNQWRQTGQWGQSGQGRQSDQWGRPNEWGPGRAGSPGIIALRPLLLGEILDGAVQLIRQAPRVVLGLSAAVAVVGQLLTLGLALAAVRGGFSSGPAGDTVTIGIGGTSGIAGFVINGLLQLVLAGMLTAVAAELVLGREVSLAATWQRVRPLLWRLVVGASLATLMPYLGLIALLVGGVFLWVTFALTTPALVLERLGPLQALRRSFHLALPDFWRVLGIRLLAFVIAGLIASVITLPVVVGIAAVAGLGLVGSSTGTVLLVVATSIAGIVASTITAPFTAGVDALLYIDRRMRSEGLDIRLRDAVQAQARSTGTG